MTDGAGGQIHAVSVIHGADLQLAPRMGSVWVCLCVMSEREICERSLIAQSSPLQDHCSHNIQDAPINEISTMSVPQTLCRK